MPKIDMTAEQIVSLIRGIVLTARAAADQARKELGEADEYMEGAADALARLYDEITG